MLSLESKKLGPITATTAAFYLRGGYYAFTSEDTVFGGDVAVEGALPDGSFLGVPSTNGGLAGVARLTANGFCTLFLSPGQYRFAITGTFNGCQCSIATIPYNPDMPALSAFGSPNPGFVAPLTSSLSAYNASGVVAATFTRAGATATVVDFEGNVRTTLANEARFTGARRVQNDALENIATAWNTTSGITFATGVLAPDGTNTAFTLTATAPSSYAIQIITVLAGNVRTNSVFIRRRTGTGNVSIYNGAAGPAATILPITSNWLQFTPGVATSGAGNAGIGVLLATSGDAVDVWHPQSESVAGQSNQNPSEDVRSTWNDTGAAGVRYFEYLNGNTVTNNVVTQAQGAPLTTLKKYLDEPAATNYFLNSGAPATQTTGSLGVGTYTCWVKGAGSIAISAGTATITGGGSATAATPLVFVVTVAGTVVCTYAATLTFVQVENNPFPTSEIDTAGTTVTRNADLTTYPTAGNILAAQGTLYFEMMPQHAAGATVIYWGSFVDANNYVQVYHNGTQLVFYAVVATVVHSAVIANSYTAGTLYKIVASWGAGGKTITVNGVEGTPDADTTALQLAANMAFGGSAAVTFEGAVNAGNLRIWQAQLPVATRAALTT